MADGLILETKFVDHGNAAVEDSWLGRLWKWMSSSNLQLKLKGRKAMVRCRAGTVCDCDRSIAYGTLSTNILRKKWILAKSGIEARLSTDQRSGMAWRYERATSCRPKIISGQRRRLFQCACGVWRSIRDNNKPRLTQKIRRIDHAQRMPTAWGDRPAAPLRRENVLGQPACVFWWARASDCVEHFF